MSYPRYGKFNNRKTEYNGVLYDSKKEAYYAQELDLRQRGKDIKSWERQVAIPLVVNGKKVCKYVVDFVLHYPDGSVELVEVKGYPTAIWRLKRKLFEATYLVEHSDYKYTVVT